MMKILVAIDFSDATPEVAEHAGKLARAMQGVIHLIHVVEPRIAYDVAGIFPEDVVIPKEEVGKSMTIKALSEMRLRQLAEELTDQWGVLVRSKVTDEFDTQEAIETYAEKEGADMIIVGNHSHSFLSSVFLGSVAEEVIRHAKVPVLVVPVKAFDADKQGEGA